MCDASDYAMRAILGRWKVKFSVIYYARKTLNDAQLNYFTTKRASNYGLCLWYISILSYGIKGHSLHKSCSVKIFDDKEGCQSETDLLVFFTVRFDLESKVRNEVKILYLTTYLDFSLRSEKSQLKSKRSSPISRFYSTRLFLSSVEAILFWVEILFLGKSYSLKARYISNYTMMCSGGRNISYTRAVSLIIYAGHFGTSKIVAKILRSKFYWSSIFKDGYLLVKKYNRCQHIENILRMKKMPLDSILWRSAIDLMGTFSSLLSNQL